MQTKSTIPAKNKPKKGVPVIDGGPGADRRSNPHWSSLGNIEDPEAVWPEAVNRVAAAACKDKTAPETFRLVGEELYKMGVSSVFLTAEPGGEDLVVSRLVCSHGGVAVSPGGATTGDKAQFAPPHGETISHVLASGETVLTTNPEESIRMLFPVLAGDAMSAAMTLSYVCTPLGSAGDVFGVLVAAVPDMAHGTAHYVALLANIASMSFYNSRMVTEMDSMRQKIECLDKGFGSAVSALDKSLQDVVHALTVPMEKRDPYTFGHQTRVTRLAVAIAGEMGLAQHRIDGLKLAASIHDIGKIVIPFEILNRPTRLSEAEFNLIKMHPQVAFDMLSPISFRWPVAEIVRQHHERIDGSGYPRGLKSGQMLPEAKILAVADVVEAMSSHRPYRASLGIDAALEEISNKSGTLFDTEAVAACIRLLLIKNFSLEGGTPSPWQSANPFTPVKTGSIN